MISLQLGRFGAPPERREGTWGSAAVAVALTWAWIAGMSLAWRQPSAAEADVRDLAPPREAIVQLTLPAPRAAPVPDIEPSRVSNRSRPLTAPDVVPPIAPSRDSAAPSAATTAAPPAAPAPSSVGAMAPSSSTRLLPSPAATTPWYSAPAVHSPFVRGAQASAAERDSTLAALGAEVPALAARRVAPQSEVDARAKEAMLKMRLTGRILLVPPDNTGGLITAKLPLPFLSSGPSRARRRREQAAMTADRAVQARLQQRVDSLKRARADSAAQAASAP